MELEPYQETFLIRGAQALQTKLLLKRSANENEKIIGTFEQCEHSNNANIRMFAATLNIPTFEHSEQFEHSNIRTVRVFREQFEHSNVWSHIDLTLVAYSSATRDDHQPV